MTVTIVDVVVSSDVMIDECYAYGFFDGEGTIIQHRKSIEIHVTQCQLEVLEQFRERWGGTICVQRDGPVSDVRANGVHRKVWRWKLVGYNAYTWLKNSVEYLIVKKQKALEIIEYWESRNRQRNRMPNEYYTHRKNEGKEVKLINMDHEQRVEELKYRKSWMKERGWD